MVWWVYSTDPPPPNVGISTLLWHTISPSELNLNRGIIMDKESTAAEYVPSTSTSTTVANY